MNPCLWLKDYRLACRAGGADSDYIIIRNQLVFLVDLAPTWLESPLQPDPQLVELEGDIDGEFPGHLQTPQ
jgi:hypothetical protein